MSRVLLLGESWFVHSIHQKGFDSFTTSEYTLGGGEFTAALRAAGHEVAHIPAHEIDGGMPTTADGLREIADVIVISDVGANTFQIPAATFTRSEARPDAVAAIRDFATGGGGLLMVGGYMTFSGIDARARWGRTALAGVLPIEMLDRDDRVEASAGLEVIVEPDASGHPVLTGLGEHWPELLGLNEVREIDRGTVLARAGGHPLLVVGECREGRSAAFTSDLAPHWAPPAFLAWEGYGRLFDQLIRWLARAS